MAPDWRKRSSGEPGSSGKCGTENPDEADVNLVPVPRTPSEWSRRAILDVVGNVLVPHWESLTLVGAHAVILQTQNLDVSISATGDGDLGVTPSLVLEEPTIDALMRAAGFAPRTDARPGLWGRGRRRARDGETVWDEQIDLIAGEGLSGNTKAGKRSVAALSGHGRSVGNTPGIELAAFDRSIVTVNDLMDPQRSIQVNVAGHAALICAKAYKLGERLDDGGRRLRDKDAGDLWRILRCADQAAVTVVFAEYDSHDVIGQNVKTGRAYVANVLRSPVVRQMAKNTFEGEVLQAEIDKTFDGWVSAFPEG